MDLYIISVKFFNSINLSLDNAGVACGPGFSLQVLAFPTLIPTRAAGFTLRSLTRPTLWP